jgi:hypothetical protein
MIVQPTPTNPRSPVRRGLRLAGLAVPVVLLGAAVGVGLLGPRVEPPAASPGPATSAMPAEAIDESPETAAVDGRVAPPAVFEGVEVVPVEALDAGTATVPPGTAVATSGRLSIVGPPDACTADPDPLGAWCAREGVLSGTSRNLATPGRAPHVHLVVPPGVRLPAAVREAHLTPDAGGTHAIVIGRFGQAGEAACTGIERDCGDLLVVERVAWVDGERARIVPLLADPLVAWTGRLDPFEEHLGPGELPLSAVLAPAAGMAAIDAGAAEASLAAGEPPGLPLWYVRILGAQPGVGGARDVRWMVLTESGLRVVATSAPAGFPAEVAGLPVVSVAAARSMLPGTQGRPVAVAGYLERLGTSAACPGGEGDTRGLLGPLCERRARLTMLAMPSDGDGAGAVTHLHVRVPPGVRLPGVLEDRDPDGPVAVVLVGRAEEVDADCPTIGRGCHDRFVADLVAWAQGEPFDPGPVFDAGLIVIPPAFGLRTLDEAVSAAAGTTEPSGSTGPVANTPATLVAAVVRPGTVARIDPAAAAAMATGPEPGDLVWYVRVLAPADGADGTAPGIAWAVVDEATGVTLARGASPG